MTFSPSKNAADQFKIASKGSPPAEPAQQDVNGPGPSSFEPEGEDRMAHIPNVKAEYRNARYNEIVESIRTNPASNERVNNHFKNQNSEQVKDKIRGEGVA